MLPPIALPTEVPTGSVNARIDSMHASGNTVNAGIRDQIAKALTLTEMLERVTPENSHEEVFSDGPVGNEEW